MKENTVSTFKCILILVGLLVVFESCKASDSKRGYYTDYGTSSEYYEYLEQKENYKDYDPTEIELNYNIKSDCFAAIGYDDDFNKLILIFKESEDKYIYVYEDISYSEYKAFKNADSLGSYYNENIKGQYTCHRYDDLGFNEY